MAARDMRDARKEHVNLVSRCISRAKGSSKETQIKRTLGGFNEDGACPSKGDGY